MINFRKATKDDARLLWEWANEETVRENAYNQGQISWDEHIEWLRKKINARKSFIFIAESNNKPIGQIRFDLKGDDSAVVDVSVDKNQRGEGFGSKIIKFGTRHFLDKNIGNEVHAYVKKGNMASKRAFEKAGYNLIDIEQIKGVKSYHLVKK